MKTYPLSNENLVKAFIVLLVIILVPAVIAFIILSTTVNAKKEESDKIDGYIKKAQEFLKENEAISSDLFDEGDEIRIGLEHNKGVYSYYTIVGTEIPKKLWLTHLKLGNKTTIEGQADNLESIYGFFRSIKDYNPESAIKLQKLGLATNSRNSSIDVDGNFDTESLLTSLNADFYEFRISNEPEVSSADIEKGGKEKSKSSNSTLPAGLEPIKE